MSSRLTPSANGQRGNDTVRYLSSQLLSKKILPQQALLGDLF